MASLKDRVLAPVREARERVPVFDHTIRTVEHYGATNGSLYASGVALSAFLSVFPLLGLAFAVVGFIARWMPPGLDAEQTLVQAINSVLPGIVQVPGQPAVEGALKLSTFRAAAPAILSIGLPLALWSGLSWLSSLQSALQAIFEETRAEQPNWFVARLRDLKALAVLGTVLLLSVAISGVVGALAPHIVDWLHLPGQASWLLRFVAPLDGLAANAVLFSAMFVLLARPRIPRRAVRYGALLGAIGFEVLKQASAYLLKSTAHQPAFQAFGIALILLVWINYFSQLVLYAASWAFTSAGVDGEGHTAMRVASGGDRSTGERVGVAPAAAGVGVPQAWRRASSEPLKPAAAAGAGALGAAALGALAWRLLGRPRD
jgi:membrane protein